MTAELAEIEADATVVAELTVIYERDGELTAENVLAAASKVGSRLNRYFEWDDTAAAHLYRLDQARHLIRRVTIELMGSEVRAFVHVPSAGTYAPVRDAMERPDWRADFLAQFERAAAAFEAKWATHKHVASAYAAWVKKQARGAA